MRLYAVFRYGAILCAALALAGCGTTFFAGRQGNPIIEDYVGGAISGGERLGFLGTTASHRLVTVRLNTDGGIGETGTFCPEPPPDVGQSIADSFAAALAGGVTTPAGGFAANADAAVASSFVSAVSPLLQRSQGLQFFRDGMYYLCVARMNEFITADQFQRQSAELRAAAHDLVLHELDRPSAATASAALPAETLRAAADAGDGQAAADSQRTGTGNTAAADTP
ncbi:MAG: hypothetical protein KDA64_17825 [Rhodospirillaceae bacterium]|nr:hypothetical protein [Rhodospirillaceae bacterium]